MYFIIRIKKSSNISHNSKFCITVHATFITIAPPGRIRNACVPQATGAKVNKTKKNGLIGSGFAFERSCLVNFFLVWCMPTNIGLMSMTLIPLTDHIYYLPQTIRLEHALPLRKKKNSCLALLPSTCSYLFYDCSSAHNYFLTFQKPACQLQFCRSNFLLPPHTQQLPSM